MDEWGKMVLTLDAYARKQGYILAAAFGVQVYDSHYYYVRSDFADSAAMVERIREIPYYWWPGPLSVNYAKVKIDLSSPLEAR